MGQFIKLEPKNQEEYDKMLNTLTTNEFDKEEVSRIGERFKQASDRYGNCGERDIGIVC